VHLDLGSLKLLIGSSKNRKLLGACLPSTFAESVDGNILKKNLTRTGFAGIVGLFFLARNDPWTPQCQREEEWRSP